MKTKHTPGPWKAERHGSRLEVWNKNTLIAHVNETHLGSAADDEANARLLAAAPELLKACEYVLRELQLKWPSFHGDIKAELETAIAKATGGAE